MMLFFQNRVRLELKQCTVHSKGILKGVPRNFASIEQKRKFKNKAQ